jgi:hypothetical protein
LGKNAGNRDAFLSVFHINMAMKKFGTLAAVGLLVFIAACKHESLRDKTLPVIVINTPAANQYFIVGDSITISGTITDINELEETGIHIISSHDQNEFLHLHYGLIHSNTWNFSVKQRVTHTQTTAYEIEVEGIDAEGNTSHKTVEVDIN